MKSKNLTNQVIIGLVGISVVFIAIYSFLGFNMINEYMFKSKGGLLLEAVNISAGQIDAELHEELLEGDEETDTYELLAVQLRNIQKQANLKYLYTLRRMNEDYGYYVIDTDITEDRCDIGERYELLDTMKRAFEGESVFDEEPDYEEDEVSD